MSAPSSLKAPAGAERPPLRLLERPRQAPRPAVPAPTSWSLRVERWALKFFG